MGWIIGVPAVALAIGVIVTASAARQRGSWGLVMAPPMPVGDGPYRASLIEMYRRRSVPPVTVIASALGIGWGLLTMFVFAPAGIVLCLFALPAAGSHPITAVGFAALMVSIIHGFALGARLIGLSRALVVHARAASTDAIRGAARATLIQHLLVAGAFALIALPRESGLFAIAAVPCAIGLVLAGLLAAAHAAHRRADERPDLAGGV